MDMVYAVMHGDEVCFITDNEHDMLKYLDLTPNTGYSHEGFIKEKGIDAYTWLDNGHIIDEMTEFLKDDYYVTQFHLNYDYRHDSPYFLKEIK